MQIAKSEDGIDIFAPAKVNLFLELLDRRTDGFHGLETVMVGVSLFDRLRLRPAARGTIALECHHVGPPIRRSSAAEVAADLVPTDRRNLVWQAALALREAAGRDDGVAMTLAKNIPVAAGLGGGSSDAAAALVGLNRLWRLQWSVDRLADVAARVGSDIPFFLYGAAGLCRGKGEQVQPLDHRRRPWLVIAKPPVGLATADVYAQARLAERPQRADEVIAFLRGQSAGRRLRLFNRLTEAASRLTDWVGRLASAMSREPCLAHVLSGSGSAYVGVFGAAATARRSAARLRARLPSVDVRVARVLGGPRG